MCLKQNDYNYASELINGRGEYGLGIKVLKKENERLYTPYARVNVECGVPIVSDFGHPCVIMDWDVPSYSYWYNQLAISLDHQLAVKLVLYRRDEVVGADPIMKEIAVMRYVVGVGIECLWSSFYHSATRKDGYADIINGMINVYGNTLDKPYNGYPPQCNDCVLKSIMK